MYNKALQGFFRSNLDKVDEILKVNIAYVVAADANTEDELE